MSDPVRAVPSATQAMKPNQIMIIGRLDHVSKFENKFDHIITTAAPDEFSKPSVLRLSSSTRLGAPGEMVKCLSVFNGWPNNYQSKNGEPIKDAKGYFVAVE